MHCHLIWLKEAMLSMSTYRSEIQSAVLVFDRDGVAQVRARNSEVDDCSKRNEA